MKSLGIGQSGARVKICLLDECLHAHFGWLATETHVSPEVPRLRGLRSENRTDASHRSPAQHPAFPTPHVTTRIPDPAQQPDFPTPGACLIVCVLRIERVGVGGDTDVHATAVARLVV